MWCLLDLCLAFQSCRCIDATFRFQKCFCSVETEKMNSHHQSLGGDLEGVVPEIIWILSHAVLAQLKICLIAWLMSWFWVCKNNTWTSFTWLKYYSAICYYWKHPFGLNQTFCSCIYFVCMIMTCQRFVTSAICSVILKSKMCFIGRRHKTFLKSGWWGMNMLNWYL